MTLQPSRDGHQKNKWILDDKMFFSVWYSGYKKEVQSIIEEERPSVCLYAGWSRWMRSYIIRRRGTRVLEDERPRRQQAWHTEQRRVCACDKEEQFNLCVSSHEDRSEHLHVERAVIKQRRFSAWGNSYFGTVFWETLLFCDACGSVVWKWLRLLQSTIVLTHQVE